MPPDKDPLKIEPDEDILLSRRRVAEYFVNKKSIKSKTNDCPECGKTFELPRQTRQHIRRVHGDKVCVCEHCDAKFTCNDSLKRHVRQVHLGELVVCSFCPYEAKEKKSVMNHAKKVHPLNDLDKLTLKQILYPRKDPIRINHRTRREYKWQCEQCDAMFSNKDTFKSHVKVAHVIPRPKLKTCPHCVREFSREDTMIRHISFSHEGHSFECNFCARKFKEKRHLLRHINKVHPSENMNANSFKEIKSCPNNYFRTRSNPNPDHPMSKYCPHCGKHFPKDLARHIKRVHGEKSLSCGHCDAKFSRNDGLQRHLKTIHFKERFQCDFCQFSATDKRSVVEHVKRVHPSKDLNNMKFEIVIGESSSKRTGLTSNDAIIERFKLLLDQ